MAESIVFHLLASDEDRVEGFGLYTVCNRYLGWYRVVPSWVNGLLTIYPEYRCRQCENPGVRNPRVAVLAETEKLRWGTWRD